MTMQKQIALVVTFWFCSFYLRAQYIAEVLEYTPAPGQFVNDAPWGVPSSAKSLIGTITGSLSLGAFGGYLVFKFDDPVENHPDNPYGVDFTIFGNPLNEWSEHGIVSVMKDENKNGLPDDTWYELAGSEYYFSSTIKGYKVTYNNPNSQSTKDILWTDNHGNDGAVLTNEFHLQSYYPFTDSFPQVNDKSYTLTGTRVASEVDKTNPSYVKSYQKAFGYVDNQLRGTAPFTIPDNPYTPDLENSGGDGFDISWAVDSSGRYVDLDIVHFIKVHNAVLANAGWLGEVSTEITGAVDVSPNKSISGELKSYIINPLPDTIVGDKFQLEAFAFHEGRWNKKALLDWESSLDHVMVSDSNWLHFTASGELELTLSFVDAPQPQKKLSTILRYKKGLTHVEDPDTGADIISAFNRGLKPIIYPNPSSDFVYVNNCPNCQILILDTKGEIVAEQRIGAMHDKIVVDYLPNGLYFLKITQGLKLRHVALVKK